MALERLSKKQNTRRKKRDGLTLFYQSKPTDPANCWSITCGAFKVASFLAPKSMSMWPSYKRGQEYHSLSIESVHVLRNQYGVKPVLSSQLDCWHCKTDGKHELQCVCLSNLTVMIKTIL